MKIAQLWLAAFLATVAVEGLAIQEPRFDANKIPYKVNKEAFAHTRRTVMMKSRRAGGGGGGGGGGGKPSSGGSSSSSSSSAGKPVAAQPATAAKPAAPAAAAAAAKPAVINTASRSPPSYGGGRYYGGGSTSAYSAGRNSPSGIRPTTIYGGAAAASLLFAGYWAWGCWDYPYTNSYTFQNITNVNGNNKPAAAVNTTLPVICLCQMYNACGCDETSNTTMILDSIVGNGSYTALNKTLVNVSKVNGTTTLVLNGTLPNATDSDNSTTNSTGMRRRNIERGMAVGLFD